MMNLISFYINLQEANSIGVTRKLSLILAVLVISLSSRSQTFDRLPCIDKTFSVVMHVVLDTLGDNNVPTAAMQGAIDAVNEKFAPICVSFEICEVREIDNYMYNDFNTDSMYAEVQNLYGVQNRINVYWVEDIYIPEDVCGFASLGGITNLNSGGIVMKQAGCFGALIHEMGHYFGLHHTFEGSGIELADGSNCATEGDLVCDTPADPYVHPDTMSKYVDDNCTFIFMAKDANGQFYSPHVSNIMSYYPCTCGDFTWGQY